MAAFKILMALKEQSRAQGPRLPKRAKLLATF